MKTQKKRTISTEVPPTRNKSWRPGQKGQGGEGMSKGYGGSAGPGTGPSGPEGEQDAPKNDDISRPRRKSVAALEAPSVCLPSRDHIEKVLR